MLKRIVLPLFAGVVGGLTARYITPPVAFAQTQAQVAKEIRAQSFTLVDPSDRAIGTFTFEITPNSGGSAFRGPRGNLISPSRIVLRDSTGREIWSAGGNGMLPLTTTLR